MKSWKELFNSRYLMRGEEYYKSGYISNMSNNENYYHATANGTSPYKVMVEIENNTIEDMNCSCPHFASGNNCKHLAAFLYEIEDINQMKILAKGKSKSEEMQEYKEILDQQAKRKEQELEDRVNQLSMTELRELAKEYLKTNPVVSTTTVASQKHEIKVLSKKEFIQELRSIYDTYEHHWMIEWDEADYYCSDICAVTKQNVEALLLDNKISEAIECSLCAINELCDVDMDDSSGCLTMSFERIMELWLLILDKANKKQVKQLFKAIETLACNNHNFYYQDDLHRFITLKCDISLANQLLSMCESIIANLRIAYQSGYIKGVYVDQWIKTELELLIKLDDEKRLEQMFSKHWDLVAVKEMALNYYLDKKYYDKVRHLIYVEIVNRDFAKVINNKREEIKEVFESLQYLDDYYILLYTLLIKYQFGDYKLYLEYRNLCSEEQWDKQKNEILDNCDFGAFSPKVFKLENRYDKLFDYATNRGHEILQHYINDLKELYSEELITYYANRFSEMIVRRTNQHGYAVIMENLDMLKRIEGTDELINKLIEKSIEQFPKRRVMIEELLKKRV